MRAVPVAVLTSQHIFPVDQPAAPDLSRFSKASAGVNLLSPRLITLLAIQIGMRPWLLRIVNARLMKLGNTAESWSYAPRMTPLLPPPTLLIP